MRSYYSILQLPESATASEIKSAFKALAVKYHPDKNPDNPLMEELFKEVNQAYQVLSNPYDKARYDLQLQFGNQQEVFHSAPPPEPATYQYEGSRPKYAERKINWRENWIATGYAFGFTFIVASVIMIGIGINDYYDSLKREELLANRRAIFNQVKVNYEEGELPSAFVSLDRLGAFMNGEQDMQVFKTEAIESLIFNAQRELNRQNFLEAIFYFELIEQFAPRNPLALQEQLAYAYREAGLYGKALKKLTELLILDYNKINFYLAKAEIYRDNLMDTKEAIRYYELASGIAIRQYEAVYGKAYPLVMTGKSVPKAHYKIYTGLAQQYLANEEYARALKSTAWNINMWPDSLANYQTAIEANVAIGEANRACEIIAKARKLGLKQTFDLRCR